MSRKKVNVHNTSAAASAIAAAVPKNQVSLIPKDKYNNNNVEYCVVIIAIIAAAVPKNL